MVIGITRCWSRRRPLGLAALASLATLLAERQRRNEEQQKNDKPNSHGTYGVTPSLEPAPSFFPFMNTDRAFPCVPPSFARVPSTVTTSPIFMEVFVQPWREITEGAPISNAQFSTRPVSVFFTSM